MNNLNSIIIAFYVICHIPAFILLTIGLSRLKTRPDNAKKYLIAATIYFIIGGGICGSILF